MITKLPVLTISWHVCVKSCCTPYSFRSLPSLRRVQLDDPMDRSMPGFPVHHHLLELAQTHVRSVSDATQPSHPLSSPSPPTFDPSQNQGLLLWVSSSHQVAKVLEFQLQHQSFQWTSGLISLQSKGLSRVFSNTTVQKHPFFGAQFSLWPSSHIHTWLLEKP